MDLKARWFALCERLKVKADIQETMWLILEVNYGEAHRYYHTLTHIESCLSILDKYLVVHPEDEVHRNQLEFAFWFHDIKYVTTSSDNEEQSALMAEMAIDLMGISNPVCWITDLIMLTKHSSDEISGDPLHNIFLDIDLSILGAEPAVFKQYHRDIRKEYEWVPVEIYQAKRLEILKGFRDRKQIFKTKFMQDKFERQAKENLMRAILVSEDVSVDPI